MSELFGQVGVPGSAYEAMRTHEREDVRRERERMEAMWQQFKDHADPHFLREFPVRFNARYWEMYLTCCFIENCCEVSSKPMGPDILIAHNGTRTWIEAVEVTQGDEGNPDRPPDFEDGVAIAYPDEQVLLRYRNAIAEKAQKRAKFIEAGIVDEADPYIIAINAGTIPYTFIDDDPPHILGALYAIGPSQITIAISSGETLSEGNVYRPSVTRTSGSAVSMDVFLGTEHAGISGVIYSGANAWNMPAEMGSDLIYVPNMHAIAPVPNDLFPFPVSWHAERQGDDGLVIHPIRRNEDDPRPGAQRRAR